jgi:RNA polymerase sigma-70 factor (ECF subfamily)
MRRKGASVPTHIQSLDELMPDEAELGRLLQDAAAGPEANLLHAEQHHLLHQAVLRIPAQLRIVLVLYDMEELTTEQVAQILGLQPGTVRVRLHRARLAVRKEMNRTLDDAPELPTRGKPAGIEPAAKKSRSSRAKGGQRPTECRELFANLSEYLDGRVEPQSCEEMRGHIESCPACVAFLRDLRVAIDRCRSLEIPCDPAVAPRLRSILTQEYLRLLGIPSIQK